MKLPLTGGCQCGAVRYAIAAPPLTLYVCHCTECQRQSASAFGMSMRVPYAAVTIAGSPREWQRRAASGRTMSCLFCGTCGSRLFHNPLPDPQFSTLKPGTLDDTSWLCPVGHIWTRSAQTGVHIPEGLLLYETQPSDFAPLIEAFAKQIAEQA